MVHIEKLSLKNVGRYTWQTFVDNFLGTKETRSYMLEERRPNVARMYINSEILTPLLLPKLNGVTLGKYFGMNGVDLDELLTQQLNIENLVIEISVDHISSMPKNKLKALLESYSVILCDFEEGGNLFVKQDTNLVKFLSDRNIKPRQLFLVGSGVQLKDYPPLNIHKIHYEHWLIITATINDDFLNNKQQLLEIIDTNTPSNFCIIPIFKPRPHRLDLLAYLDAIEILTDCEWSLAYNANNKLNSYQHLFANTSNLSNLTVHTFLEKHNLPKFISNVDITSYPFLAVIAPDKKLFNKHKYHLVVETFLGDEMVTPMGGCGLITEKTYKPFLTGSAPIIYGPQEMNARLKITGFKTLTEHIDIDDYQSIGNLLKDLYHNQSYEKLLIQHNFDLITNKDFLADQVAAPLNKIAELINSVRR
jgi:hypothetical protein